MAGTQPTGRTRGATGKGNPLTPIGGGDDRDFALLDLLPQPAFVIAVDGDDSFRFIYANERYCALLGVSDDAVLDGDLRAVLPTHALVPHVRQLARAAHGNVPVRFQVDLGTTTRRSVVAIEVAPVVDDRGRCRTLLGVAHDITEHRRLDARLAHRSRHDAHTQLPNRLLLLERLSNALDRAKSSGRRVGILVLDLDTGGVVNGLGQTTADDLLGIVARRVERVCRLPDTVARLGDDQLAIVCNDARDADDALALARRVRAVLDDPISIDGHEVVLAVTVGVVMSSGFDDDPARMLRDADVALIAAKNLGRGRVELFDDRMREKAVARLELEAALRRALVRGEFRLYYQPIVRLDRSEVVGFEALLRWHDPERGLVLPGAFLPVAEETGLIVPIGGWVLAEACRQAREWVELRRGDERPLVMSVNLSVRQFEQPGLVEHVAATLRETGLDPAGLRLEITESVMARDTESTIRVLRGLKALGVRLAIDDFGTGYSSLNYLTSFMADTLKIDQSFVSRLGHDDKAVAIVQAVTALAKALGMAVTAEGIETVEQLTSVRAIACDQAQGFYFSRPITGAALTEVLRDGPVWATVP